MNDISTYRKSCKINLTVDRDNLIENKDFIIELSKKVSERKFILAFGYSINKMITVIYRLLIINYNYEEIVSFVNKHKYDCDNTWYTILYGMNNIDKDYWKYFLQDQLGASQISGAVKALKNKRIIKFHLYNKPTISLITSSERYYELFLQNEKYFYPGLNNNTYENMFKLLDIGVSPEEFKQYLNKDNYYALKVLYLLKNEHFEEGMVSMVNEILTNRFEDKLLDCVDLIVRYPDLDHESIYTFIKQNNISKNSLIRASETLYRRCPMLTDIINKINSLVDYVSLMNKQESIDRKINKSKELKMINDNNRKQELLYSQNIVNNYISDHDNKPKNHFCKKYNLSIDEFDRCVSIVKDFDIQLYDKYIEIALNVKNRTYAILINTIECILKDMSEIGNDYSLLDYHLKTKTSVNELYDFMIKNEFSKNDKYIMRKFMNRNINNMKYCKVSSFIDTNWVVKGHEFTIQEKESIVSFARKNNLPSYLSIFREIGRRYLSGKLIL